MSLSKLRGNENIADVVSLEPYADIDQIRETLINVIRWLGDREPVAPGDVFLKFATYGGLVDLGLVTTQELLTNEDNPGDGNDPAAPEELYVEFYAKDMTPSVTAGCSTLQVVETASANPNLHFLAFDPSTNESCDFVAILPAGWTGGTFQFRIYWSHGFGSVAWNTVWELQANSYKTGETLARVLVPGTLVRGTGGAVDGLYITNESDPVYISGELNSPGNLVLLRITRKATDALDTLTVDARLHAIRFNLGNAPVDYPPPETDCEWDSATASGTWTLSAGNKTAQCISGTAVRNIKGTVGRDSGKRYFEVYVDNCVLFGTGVREDIGVMSDPGSLGSGGSFVDSSVVPNHQGAAYRIGGAIFVGSTNAGAVTSLANTDVVGVAIDIDAKTVWFSRNGTWTQGDPGTATSPEGTIPGVGTTYYPAACAESPIALAVSLRTKASEFVYPIPTGFVSWASD